MKRLDIIPYPNKINYLGGDTCIDRSDVRADISSALDEEEYILTVEKEGVKIIAGSQRAMFYARQSLGQLGDYSPCVMISDKPAYPYRGFMLDTCRHFFGVEETKKLIDAAASVKMNVMHWHLSDDQGFRIYLDSRPEAALLGSVRRKSNFGSLKEEGEYGGYFTKDRIKEIVDYAAARYITVIPEIDVPGHSSALIHAYPNIGCTGENIDVKCRQGIYEDILCAGKDETLDVVYDILGEIAELFPSEYIHIGGDEAPKTRWKQCPHCQERIKKEGLNSAEELQGWFTNKIVKFLAAKGKKAIVWNESLKSGLVSDVVVQMWMDKKKLSVAHAEKGGKMINSDFFRYYCDYPYSMTPLLKTYRYDPMPKKLKHTENMIGVEAPIWTEYINNFDRLCYMCFPRFTAVAETGWTERKNKNPADFQRRFRIYSERLAEMGVNAAPVDEWNPSSSERLTKTISFFAKILAGKDKED